MNNQRLTAYIKSNFTQRLDIMQLLSDNPINLYTTLLHEADELLDYWQEQLLTDNRPEWVEGKIKRTKIAIADCAKELEQLTNK